MSLVEVQSHVQPRSRTTGRVIIGLLVLITLAFGLLPSPYAVQEPGPVLNTLGTVSIDGEERAVIEITGDETVPSEGVLNMLTVRMMGHPDRRLSFFEVVPYLFRSGVQILRLSDVYPQGQTIEERDEVNQALMENSQVTATVAALRALDREVEGSVRIVDVLPDTPAAGVVAPDDIVLEVAGVAAEGSAQVRHLVGEAPAEQPLEITVLRSGVAQTLSVTPTWSETAQRSMIGVTLVADYDLPIDVDIALERTGGPSAGMVFTLAIMEALTEEDLIGDIVVSGTGTIDDSGAVGGVGGVPSKVQAAADAGSDLLLVPMANCSDLPARIPSGLTVAPIHDLGEALEVIERARAGETVPGPERCNGTSFSAAM